MSLDEATLGRLRDLAEAAKAGGWSEVVAGLDMGDVVIAIRERGSKGDGKAAAEATGLHVSTLWRRAKLAEHRGLIEDADPRPANLTEAWKLVQRHEAEAKAGAGGEGEAKPARGRRKRDPVEALTERLRDTASLIAQQALMGEDDAVAIVRAAFKVAAKVAALAVRPEVEEGEPLLAPDGRPWPTGRFDLTVIEEGLGGFPEPGTGTADRAFRRKDGGIELVGYRTDSVRMGDCVIVFEGGAWIASAAPFMGRVASWSRMAEWLLADEDGYRTAWTAITKEVREQGRRVLLDTTEAAIATRAERYARYVEAEEKYRREREKPALRAEVCAPANVRADRSLIAEPTDAMVIVEGEFGTPRDFNPGLYTELRLDGGWLRWTVRTKLGVSMAPFGARPDRGAVLVVQGRQFVEGWPGGPDEPRRMTPDEYRDHWRAFRDATVRAGRRILFDNVDDAIASYPGRVAEAEKRDAERRIEREREDAREAAEGAFEAGATVRLRDEKGVAATIIAAARGGEPFLQEVRLFELTYGPWKDGERADYAFRPRGGKTRHGPEHRSVAWTSGGDSPFAILRGRGLGVAEVDEHGFSRDDAGLTWAEVARKARACGAEFLVDRLPAEVALAEEICMPANVSGHVGRPRRRRRPPPPNGDTGAAA